MHYGDLSIMVFEALQKSFILYLKDRKQFAVIANETSTTKEILTGIPQGSVLGSLLFFIYINI